MQEPQTLSDQQNTSISTKMVWYGLRESQAALLHPSIPAPSRDKNYLSVIVACIPRLHITATHQQLRFDGKIPEMLMCGTQQTVLFLCSNQPFISAGRVKWTSHSPHASSFEHFNCLVLFKFYTLTGKRLRHIVALKYLSTICPLQISEQPRHICSSGHWEGPQIPHKKNGNASESIRAHDSLTTSGLQRPNKNHCHFLVSSYSLRVPKLWCTKRCSTQRQGTGSSTPITCRWSFCLA